MRTLEKSSNVLLSLCTVEQQFSHQSTKYSLFKTYIMPLISPGLRFPNILNIFKRFPMLPFSMMQKMKDI